jgi:hypothetical protein
MHYLSSGSSLIVGGKSIARRPLVPMYLFNQVYEQIAASAARTNTPTHS